MPYPCCCQRADCEDGVIITMSGVANGSCSSCGTQYNDSILTTSGNDLGGLGFDDCGVTSDTVYCYWEFGQDSNPCFGDDSDSIFIMFTGTDTNKYAAIMLEDETFGGFGGTFAIWLKQIADFTLPVTFDAGDECLMEHAKCDFSGVEITVSAP